MTKPDDEAQRLREQLHRNQIITAVIAAVLVAFVVALYLGAFSKTEFKEIPPWVSALTSVVAATISAYAVYLVARTLEATRETLDATRQMADDQRRIGDSQVRPWVFMKKFTLVDGRFGPEVVLEFKNYGNTPATFLQYGVFIKCYGFSEEENIELDEDGVDKNVVGNWFGGGAVDDYLIPGGERTFTALFSLEERPDDVGEMEMIIEWSYDDITGSLNGSPYHKGKIVRLVSFTGDGIAIDDPDDVLFDKGV